ncbi:MAG: helix-turn-helix transcriptional regulator [Pseudomonadota bacterium]
MTNKDIDAKAMIASRIKEARKMAGLSQGQVAKLMNMHRPTISEIEAGNRKVSADEASRLAKILDVNIEWLMGKTPEGASDSDLRIELAARELYKMDGKDLERLLKLIFAMRSSDGKGDA